MSPSPQAAELETALLERAKAQSEKFLSDARRMRDELLAAANERLRTREQREARTARELSERNYRQRVQAGEIRLRRELDWQRWQLVQDTVNSLSVRLRELVERDGDYLPLLAEFLAKAASEIGTGELVAELNARDQTRLYGKWESFCRDAGVAGTVQLGLQPLPGTGGIRVRDAANTVCVDFTIEARLERMQEALRQVISARLFPQSEFPEGELP
ncbi:MAG: V-type ATP synthase subunit E family protein [Gammaproteobacteria bacterium]|nr:V-type ATP synthase subunit E family protein [Gammaproteobacteria bacterium]